MKYIDADKLIAEIEGRIIEHRKSLKKDITLISEAMLKSSLGAYESIEHFIASLQQEEPKFKVGDTIHKIGENTVFPMTIERIDDVDYVCDGGKCFVSIKFQDDYELVEQEQPEVDLEKSLDEYYKNADFGPSEAIEYEIHKDIARHFYELGLNARKEK